MKTSQPLGLLAMTVAVTLLAAGCQSARPGKRLEQLHGDLHSLIDDVHRKDSRIPGVALHVEMPSRGLSWNGASGFADPTNKVPLTVRHPMRIASITKTFVTTAILRLAEEGRLSIDSSIATHLPPNFIQILRREGYQTELITLRHLLTHTSGLFDYADSKEFNDAYRKDPLRRWTRIEQLQAAADWGDPYGAAGEKFHYSDTGYILLGEIIETVTGLSMAEALRSLVSFEQLGLTSTWLETLEPPPEGVFNRAHQYEGDFDTYLVDPSIDLYGGGGLVSTVGDLTKFMRGLFGGHVFRNPKSLEDMLSPTQLKPGQTGEAPIDSATMGYRMGIEVLQIHGLTAYWHTGYWGTMAAFVPDLDLSIGATVNQQENRQANLLTILRRVVELVLDLEADSQAQHSGVR